MHKLYFISLLFLSFISYAQVHLLKEIPLSEQVNSAEVIAEGEVIAKKSYWDSNKHNIYTVNTIDLSKLYKGASTNQINIVTSGGIVGRKAQKNYPNLELNKADKGTFILEKFNLKLEGYQDNLPLFQVTGMSQGFFRYDTRAKKIQNPFNKVSSAKELNQKLIGLTNKQPKQLKAVDYFEVKKKEMSKVQAANVVVASISSINPTQIIAGDKSVLTINGSSFGNTAGKVHFKNADDAGASTVSALATQIVSWTDTQIQVEVPGKAGSGTLNVITSANTTTQITGLVVTDAIIIQRFKHPNIASGVEQEYPVFHVGNAYDKSSNSLGNFDNGAYLFTFHTDFDSNAAAKSAFLKAFDLLVCNAGIKLKISTQTTTTKDIENRINSISFDPLSVRTGVVKIRSLGTGNGSGGMYWYIHEMDYSYNDKVIWSFDSSATTISEYDFSAITRHETAHAAGLGHVIDTQKIMHWSIGKGDKSQLKSDTTYDPSITKITHDKTVTPPSSTSIVKTDFSGCYKQSLGIDAIEQSAFQLYPNPASDFITVAGLKTIEAVAIYNITGALIHEASVADGIGSSEVSIDLGNYTSGIYFTKVSDATGSQSLRFVKE